MALTLSVDAFDRDAAEARRAADTGPVIITDEGRPSHVLLSIAEYGRLMADRRSIAEALAMGEAGDFDFDSPRLDLQLRPAEFDG